MRAIVYSSNGDTSVLELVDRPLEAPGSREVRVRIVVSGVNPTDWKSRSSGPRTGGGIPDGGLVPNQDGAGIVDAIGDAVTEVAVGDRVWLMLAAHERSNGGTAQEYSIVPVERVAPLPSGADFELGASLGVPAVTAHRALTVADGGPSRLAPGALDGTVVLVAGGAGAVGHAAIQLARWAGATVVATVSGPEKAGLASAAGAHHTIDYTQPDAAVRIRAIAPAGVDTIVEVAAGRNAELDRAVLKTGGIVSIYANNGEVPFTLDVVPNMVLNARYQFVLLYTVTAEALAAAALDVTAAVADGALPIGTDAGLPVHRYPLERTAEAHDAVESGVTGKVLIVVAEDES